MTERNYGASSASFFSQAEIPLAPAFRRYDAFSAAVQRKCTCLVLRSLAGNGGLPLGLGLVMRLIVHTRKSLTQSLPLLYCVYTLNREIGMDTKTKEMIQNWIKSEGKEAAAKFVSKTINCGINEARRLVEEATS